MKSLIFLFSFFIAYTSIGQPTWQQRVDTKIDVRLDDKHHFLHAFEELTYTNNSPDTLRFVYIHLWPNAYKNDRTPFAKQMDLNGNTAFYYAKPKDRGYIDSLQFTINGHSVEYNSADATPDIARIDLPLPLLPGQSIKIATPFRVKVPKVFSRMGHTGQSYYISQWFPKPAVYDQKGWHPISYLDQGEFFSEYGSYDVNITLPANYVLMATGNCMDEKENQWLDDLSKRPLPANSSTIKAKNLDSAIASSHELKTVRFHEDNVHDFAWFADKRWLVQKDTVYSPGNNQLVTTYAAFMPAYTRQWKKATGYLKETVKHYGKWVGPYQYKTIKAVLGDMRAGGGMEYPTITIIDKGSVADLQKVIVHEGGHNWFYGMLGSNERDHAWMDEGINTFYEQKTKADLAGRKRRTKLDESLLYFESATTHNDQATDQTSANFTKLNYGLDIYFKTALMLRWLEQYMGEDNFEAGMKDYYNTWHFHHPYPEDFERCMQKHSTKSIYWFTHTLLTTDKKIDYTILKAKINGSNTDVTVRNNTGVAAPLLIDSYDGDSLMSHVWTDTFNQTTTVSLPGTQWNKLRVDDVIPDAKSTNDVYHKGEPGHHFGLEVRPFFGLNRDDKDKLFISPAVGYNQYDGIMAGLVFHDITLPENRFRYALVPMYAFGTQSIVGTGSIGYLWYPDNLFKQIMLQADGKTFHDNETFINLPNRLYAGYTKIAPSLTFTFNEYDPLSPVTRTLTLKGYLISEQNIAFSSDSLGKPVLATQQNTCGLLRYLHNNRRTYNPFSYSLEGQAGADFAKISAEGKVRVDYNAKNKSLYVRAYLGKFFAISTNPAVYSRYELTASYSGTDDYLYDGTYIGRNAINGTAAQQISIQEGGFKVPTLNNAARSDNWMAAINLETDLPKIPMLRVFFDAGLIPNANPSITHASSTTLLYDGGVSVTIIKNVVTIYIPIIMSSDFQNYILNNYGRKHEFARSVSFTIDFHNINWLTSTSSLLKNIVR